MMEIAFVIVVAVTGYTWTALLTQPGDLLDFLPPLIFPHSIKMQKVLFQCEKCFAGQLAMWSYPILFLHTYDWRIHFVVVIFSIFCAFIIARILPNE